MDTPIAATITDYAPPANESPRLIADEIKEQVATLEAQVNTLRDTITRERATVKELFRKLNDDIEDNELNKEDTITFGELSDILVEVFSQELEFLKEYQAWVEFKVRVTVDYKSKNSEEARATADNIGLDIREEMVNYDDEAEVNEIYVEETRVISVDEQ